MIKVVLVNAVFITAVFIGFHFYSQFFEEMEVATKKGATVSLDKEPLSLEMDFPGLSKDSPLWVGTDRDGKLKQLRQEVLSHYIKDHHVLAYGAPPHTRGQVRVTYGEDLVYDVVYKYDQHGRRITPSIYESDQPEHRFAFFFGGSFVHGDGVAQDQTWPYHLGALLKDHVPYNFGFPGYGAQHMFLNLTKMDLEKYVPQKKGVAFYLYFEHHRTRAVGSMNELGWTEGRYPYIDFDSRGELRHEGEFRHRRPFYTWILKNLSQWSYLKHRVADIPSPYSEKASRLLCALIVESKKRFLSMFPGNLFVAVVPYSARENDPIVDQCFVPNGITYVDLAGRWGTDLPGQYSLVPGVDDHYNGVGYKKMAHDVFKKSQKLLIK